MVCTAHRLQCLTSHFTKHKFPVVINVQTHLKATLSIIRMLSQVNSQNVPFKGQVNRLCLLLQAGVCSLAK